MDDKLGTLEVGKLADVRPHSAMSVIPAIWLCWAGGMPKASRISRASPMSANGRLL